MDVVLRIGIVKQQQLASSAFCSNLTRSSLALFTSHISHALKVGEAGCTSALGIWSDGAFGNSHLQQKQTSYYTHCSLYLDVVCVS